MNKPFSVKNRIRSFGFAFKGIWTMMESQQNAWIHLFATLVVITAGILLRIERSEWIWIILAIMSVWAAEALNTAFEYLADVANPNFHPLVAKAKDVAAGAVLVAAIGAAIIGIITFWPHVAALFS
jgi:diacylglycerol kinase (ATP)